jgi:hypothetical protein
MSLEPTQAAGHGNPRTSPRIDLFDGTCGHFTEQVLEVIEQTSSPPGGGKFHAVISVAADSGAGRSSREVDPHIIASQIAFPEAPVSDDLQAELERLRAENELLKKSGRGKLAMKVSEKGALSVYGMGRFPVTLYKEQWLKLLAMGEEIKAFIAANNEALKSKD